MQPRNVLFIMSDEHSRRVLGAYGNGVVRTPTLDGLAAGGTLFENAYCNCPICVPSRASFATGRYVHAIRYWDNAFPYRGTPPSWGHRLHDTGHRCDSIGKLHYRGSDDPNGFDNEILPLHVLKGEGDVQGMLRRPPPPRESTNQLAGDAGAGNSTYLQYDRDIRDEAIAWLKSVAATAHRQAVVPVRVFRLPAFSAGGATGVLQSLRPQEASLAASARPRRFSRPSGAEEVARGPELRGPLPRRGPCAHRHRRLLRHGVVPRRQYRPGAADACRNRPRGRHAGHLHQRPRRQPRHAHLLGQVQHVRGGGRRAAHHEGPWHTRRPAGADAGLAGRCLSDDRRRGRRSATAEERELPGTSLLRLLDGEQADRTVFSEYHAVGSTTGIFMVRFGRYKYVHYEGYRPQLFDLEADPLETRDLARVAPATRRSSPKAKGGCARSAIRQRSPSRHFRIRSGASGNWAASRRSSSAAAIPIPRRRARPRASPEFHTFRDFWRAEYPVVK